MLELTHHQLLIIASWTPCPAVDEFRRGLGKLVAKGELIQVKQDQPQTELGKFAA